ncbi:hypothetical protein JOF34_000188 [Microbacterium amylolyticum]|uniref:Uncharacterized protein n=1 Tax=Microbacterium amylolyticum TaxID=936337 RepID=A0ABS4ZEG9_9MICO|nr:hypothetical protein [Microbacterium amylolyticum]
MFLTSPQSALDAYIAATNTHDFDRVAASESSEWSGASS